MDSAYHATRLWNVIGEATGALEAILLCNQDKPLNKRQVAALKKLIAKLKALKPEDRGG